MFKNLAYSTLCFCTFGMGAPKSRSLDVHNRLNWTNQNLKKYVASACKKCHRAGSAQEVVIKGEDFKPLTFVIVKELAAKPLTLAYERMAMIDLSYEQTLEDLKVEALAELAEWVEAQDRQ